MHKGRTPPFNLMVGSGVRYNINGLYSVEVGINYMHVSNLYMSEPRYPNNGINVVGPMIGINRRVRRHDDSAE